MQIITYFHKVLGLQPFSEVLSVIPCSRKSLLWLQKDKGQSDTAAKGLYWEQNLNHPQQDVFCDRITSETPPVLSI